MRLCGCSWFIKLTLLVFVFGIVDVAYAATLWSGKKLWSSVGYSYSRDKLHNNNDFISQTTCDLSQFPGEKDTDGDPYDRRVDVKIKISEYNIITNYGDGKGSIFVQDGVWGYAEKIDFSRALSKSQNAVAREALELALRNNNCDLVDSLLEAMTNPNFTEDGILSIEDEGYKCAITTSGLSDCLVDGAAETCDENDENCHITIGNEKRMGLDELAKTKPAEKDNNAGNPAVDEPGDHHGSGSETNTDTTETGSGNANGSSSSGGTSSGSDNQGNQGNNEGATGSGNGAGSGQGDEEGEGESDGDVNVDLEEFDIRKSLEKLKAKLESIVSSKGQCVVSGDCPTISVTLFKTTHTIDIHCRLITENGEGIKSGFMFLWTTIGVLIILSA